MIPRESGTIGRQTLMGLLDRIHNFLARRQIRRLRSAGLVIGQNVHIGPMVFIDPTCCWLISIGDGSTLAPRVTILAHDASTKKHLGYTKVAAVAIGRDVFLGAGAIILPGVSIGDCAIVGAGSVVTKDVPAGAVAVGNPAAVVASVSELIEKHKSRLAASGASGDQPLSISHGLNQGQKEALRAELADRMGYVA